MLPRRIQAGIRAPGFPAVIVKVVSEAHYAWFGPYAAGSGDSLQAEPLPDTNF
jgi:hypothetical protein